MAISLAFSINIYNVSVREIDRGLRRQAVVLSDLPRFQNIMPDPAGQLAQERESSLSEARTHVIENLILINAVILFGGGLLSYYLARRSLKPIEEAHEAQVRFTADASHELRTPIAAMRTETEVALMDPKLDLHRAKKQLVSNLEELSKLTALSENLLSLSRTDRTNFEKTAIDVEEMVTTAIDRILPAAEQKSILITHTVSDGLSVFGNRASLEEVLATILDNAVKYSHDKTAIHVSAKQREGWVTISIKDQGIGIKKEDLPHIFERFYRADSARNKAKNNGYGLGLSIAKSVVDLHEGAIEVKSRTNRGSTFIISLPSHQI